MAIFGTDWRRLEPRGTQDQAGSRAIELAGIQARRSLEATLTPDLTCALLSYLALMSDDSESFQFYSSEAVRWDPNSYVTHWLRAEAYLAAGESQLGEREARIAVDLNPASREATFALARATGSAR